MWWPFGAAPHTASDFPSNLMVQLPLLTRLLNLWSIHLHTHTHLPTPSSLGPVLSGTHRDKPEAEIKGPGGGQEHELGDAGRPQSPTLMPQGDADGEGHLSESGLGDLEESSAGAVPQWSRFCHFCGLLREGSRSPDG